MAIVPLTEDQVESLKRSLEKEKASKQASQKKSEIVSLPGQEEKQDLEPLKSEGEAKTDAEDAPVAELSDSNSFKSYKKRK